MTKSKGKKKSTPRKKCFVICPIGEPGSEPRKLSDTVLRHIITPAVRAYGYEAQRADQLPNPGMITRQVINRLRKDPLVVADLTGHNANVFYELAVRHVLRKPVIQIIHHSWSVPFDLAGMRTVRYDHQDLENVPRVIEEIGAHLRHLEEHPDESDDPLSMAIAVERFLEQTAGSQGPLMEKILATVQSLQATVDQLRMTIPVYPSIGAGYGYNLNPPFQVITTGARRMGSTFEPLMTGYGSPPGVIYEELGPGADTATNFGRKTP